MKVRRFLIAQTLLCAAAILTGCARSLGDDITAENSNVDGTEWWDVTRENMDEEETTEPVTTAKTEVTEETTTETTDVTDENGNPSGGGSGGGKSNRGSSGKTKDEYYEDKAAPKEIITPDVEIFGERNVSNAMALSRINVNGKNIDILNETIDGLIEIAGLRQDRNCLFSNPFERDANYDGIFWYGRGYGVYLNAEDESLRFTGTHLFIEGISGTVLATEVDPTVKDGYKIRSVYASIGMTQDDFEVLFLGGIKCGMARAEVEQILDSRGDTTKCYTYYANKDNALVIRYGEDDTIAEIYLFNDYDYLPIQYSERLPENIRIVTEPPEGEETEEGGESETTTTQTTATAARGEPIALEDDDYTFDPNKPIPADAQHGHN